MRAVIAWTLGLLRRRPARLGGAAIGVAVAVALLCSIGAFLAGAQASMTARAARTISVDWQVEVQPAATLDTVIELVRSTPHVTAALPVGFGHSSGLSATTDGTRTTGPAVVLGVPDGYRKQWPDTIRTLAGSGDGVLVAQQTAANLGVAPGSVVQIARPGLPPVPVRVDGIVELPQADSLFRKVGAPQGAQPAAPPDNVLVLPAGQWHAIFDPLAAARPDLVAMQVHTALDRQLPSDPATAYTRVTTAAHNLEARSAGGALVGDNLGSALDAARSDAAYARVLFLFLGLPGVVLAALVTVTVVESGAARRRREAALLRARGATVRRLVALASVEAIVVGVLGCAVGIATAAAVGLATSGSPVFGAEPASAARWAAVACVAGLVIACLTVLLPAARDLRTETVEAGRSWARAGSRPRWKRWGLDVIALAAGGLLFWQQGRGGYQIVLAPEGVPSISVSYWAFVAPALLWIGGALLVWRIADAVLGPGRRAVAVALRPVTGNLSGVLARSLSRRRAAMATAIVILALTTGFAVSTATFNATYRAQAEVDALLTNGADVTVTESPGVAVPPSEASRLAAVPGVRRVDSIQHRFAYVGADLQDLYGVNPTSIASVTALQDRYFTGGTVDQLMKEMIGHPDAILVSAETVTDFQLALGDTLNLRLQDAISHRLVTVPFRYVGVVSEFPTAPKDSFFVANADYVAQATGSDAVGAFLIDTGGRDTSAVAQRVRALVGPTARVTDIADARGTVGSSLTAVDLGGLTRIELALGLCLAATVGGLVLALNMAERQRTFAIAKAIGAERKQLRAFVLAEAVVLTACGLACGAALGGLLSHVLVRALTGVFDPPPAGLTVPWPYLAATAATAVGAIAVVSVATTRAANRASVRALREL